MAIEVEVKGKASEPKREYPYLGINEYGCVVLFFSKEKGTVVRGTDPYAVGYNADDWIERKFTPLSPSETVIIRNKQ